MRRFIAIALLGFMARASAHAQGRWVSFEASVGTNYDAVVGDTNKINGYIDEVYAQIPAGVTCVVTVISSPPKGTSLPSTVLYTNGALTGTAKARPRIAQTDAAGSNLSTLTVPERFLCSGASVVFRCQQISASTGQTFRAWTKIKNN